MYILTFTINSQAQAFCATLFERINYTDNITEDYCIPLKHPVQELWAVPITDEALEHLTDEEKSGLVEYTDEWREKSPLEKRMEL